MKKLVNILLTASMLTCSIAVPFAASAAVTEKYTMQLNEVKAEPAAAEKITDAEKIRELFDGYISENHLDARVAGQEEYPGYSQPVIIEYDTSTVQNGQLIGFAEENGIDRSLFTFVPIVNGVPVTTANPDLSAALTTTAQISEQQTVTSTVVMDYATKVEYDRSPMKIGESREVHFCHPETKEAKNGRVTTTSDCVSVAYEEGSDTFTVTALSEGKAEIYVYAQGCAFGSYVYLEVISSEPVKGDTNCDGQVDMADAVLIMQALANPNKYGENGTAERHITAQGKANADMNGDGLTVGDALAIQQKLLGIETDDTDDNYVLFGYDDIKGGKPVPSAALLMKCRSFCAKGETLSVDAAMGDIVLEPGNYDTAGVYEYDVYASDGVQDHRLDDNDIIVNGEQGGYEKEYSKDDVKLFDIGKNFENYDSYHHEITEIDFSGCKTGSKGCITFAFYSKHTNDPDGGVSTSGTKRFLYYYVGEDGTTVSSVDELPGNAQPAEAQDATWGYVKYNGKTVSAELYRLLSENTDPDAELTVSPEFATDYDYEYKGKTIREYRDEWDYNSGLYEKYGQLFKQGDQLKYGETLYITGIPGGERWAEEYYYERIRFYGEEFLARYIVDGEFLREKAEADYAAVLDEKPEHKAYLAFHEAIDAYERNMIQNVMDQLGDQDIRCEYREDFNDLVLYLTAEKFEVLSLEKVRRYVIPSSDQYPGLTVDC